ncbi:N-glycosylation protein eos1 [Hypsizygus marmoreus]|uniref:N-glycosylation protein eos1 n=1 Tax=Hypsizygus marmoreus TaxID=39966 RepID=A0A369JN70_HYPMA|nr:N-glycosylation protein eos1 [Hypsizygus marmoreus]
MLSSSPGRPRASTITVYPPRGPPPPPSRQASSKSLTDIPPPPCRTSTQKRQLKYQASTSSIESEHLHPPRKRRPPRTRSSTNELGTFVPSKFLFTPADAPPAYTPTPTAAKFSAKKSSSSPLLYSATSSSPYTFGRRMPNQTHSESEDDDDRDDDEPIYTTWTASSGNLKAPSGGLRTRIFGGASSRDRDRPKAICTTPGELCAGETETEIDEPPRHLPTTRIIHSTGPVVPLNTLQQRLTPLLFEFSRLLSIVPAIFGTLYNLYHVYQPPGSRADGRHPPERIDFAISALWAILTGYQCLSLTTGLLTRWRLYYPPLPTLIRLLALQGICWPATQLTCTILEHEKRPVIVWAAIGTTTCISRGVQIWVTSNLWWETREVRDRDRDGGAGGGSGVVQGRPAQEDRGGYWKRWGGGKWGGRRWDWKEVGMKCVLPAGIVYCVMAWAEQLRREFSGC